MYNDASTVLKRTMTSMNTNYQLLPSSNHRANNAERAIKTFKDHFIAGMCSVDKDFHLQLRDRILQKAKSSLKVFRQPRTLPHLSAYTHIFREFYFNRTLVAPPETQVVIHNRPNDRASRAPYGEDGCYIGPEMEYYR